MEEQEQPSCMQHLRDQLIKAAFDSPSSQRKECPNPDGCFCTRECQEPIEYSSPSVEDYKRLIVLLPRSVDRVPYTYHHDYIRNVFPDLSRADVAAMKNWSEEELYATALIGLLDSTEPLDTMMSFLFIQDSAGIIEHAKKIAEAHLESYKK
jgi:hypothetical protein